MTKIIEELNDGNKYRIVLAKINDNDAIIIFSTDYISPLKFIKEIEKELAQKYQKEIPVYFDFFLSQISKKERFGRAVFTGKEFAKSSFGIITVHKADKFYKLCLDYYNNHKNDTNFSFTLVGPTQQKILFGE